MAARTSRDPQRKYTAERHRLLTIHQGTRLTPTLVAMLQVLVDAADELAAELHPDNPPTSYARARTLDELAPRIVARSDGLALYVTSRRIG